MVRRNGLKNQMDEDGFLRNPPEIRDYPLAPWWQEWGGQRQPDAIVGNLIHFGKAHDSLIEKTKKWVQTNLTLEKIRDNEWLFMAYHAVEFFFAVDDFPDLHTYRQAIIDNVIACAENAPENQYDSLFPFAPTPDSTIAKAMPDGLIDRFLDHLETSQQEEGNWLDQHNLPQWYPMVTINTLLALRRYGRLVQ